MQGILRSRAVLRLAGEDAPSFLQGIVTQDVMREGLIFAALLTPQGKILFDFFLHPDGDGFLIDCDVGAAPALLKRLTLYKLRAKIALSLEPDLAVAVGDAAESFVDPRLESLPRRAIVTAGAAPDADDAYDALRLSLGVPEFARDFASEEMFLLDVNYDALGGVSYAKGCFVGQEVTSRMKRKGDVRKRTLIARFDSPAPAKGSAIVAGESAIGEILSGREGIALALIRLDRLTAAKGDLTAGGRTLQISFPDYLERA